MTCQSVWPRLIHLSQANPQRFLALIRDLNAQVILLYLDFSFYTYYFLQIRRTLQKVMTKLASVLIPKLTTRIGEARRGQVESRFTADLT